MVRYLLRTLFALAMTLCVAVSAHAQNLPGRQLDDSQLTQLIVIGQPNCAPDAWFRGHPGLIQARKVMHYQLITPDSQLYKQRYANVISGVPPMVLWQRPDGGVIYSAAGSSLPTSAQGLFDELRDAWNMASSATKSQQAEDCPDCVDGTCRVPVLQPWQPDTSNPFPVEAVKSSIFSKGVTWLLIFAFCLVAFVVLGIGSILLLAVLYFVSKLLGTRVYV